MSIFTESAMALVGEELARGDIKRETYKTYRAIVTKFEKFSPALDCQSLTEKVVLDFAEWMRGRGNCENTVKKTLAALKNLVNKVMASGEEWHSPFRRIHIRGIHSTRQFLPQDELTALYNSFLVAKNLTRPEFDAMQAFLFSCFTGLRYSDLKSLEYSEIKNGTIQKMTHKTGERVYIPLCRQAITLMNLRERMTGKVLRVTENTYFNRHLRSAAAKLGCTRHIHCHIARHTFATTCLTVGIPLEVTSKLMGHREITTTQIYAKYVNKVFDTEMAKFNRLGAI